MVLVVFLFHVCLIVNHIIDRACFCDVDMRKILEIEAFFIQLLLADESFSLRIQFFQYIVVSRKNGVNISDEIRLAVILFVVIAVAARVAAEFLIQAA